MALYFPTVQLDGIKAVLIDIDNTLYAYEPCNILALKSCYLKIKDSSEFFTSSEETFYERYKHYRSIITDRFYPKAVCRSRAFAFEEYFISLKIQNARDLALDFEKLYWDTFIKNIQILPAALTFLEKTKRNNIVVVAVSDMTTGIQIRKLEKLGATAYIDALVTSEIAGIEKPSPVIFNMALEKAKCSASEAIMIGDDLEKDIKGAEALGIKTYQVIVKND